MEIVLLDGDLLRTGMGALEGSDTWQLFNYGFGPYPDTFRRLNTPRTATLMKTPG